MATILTMQDQLAMLRMVIDRRDPVHVEAEAVFAAMIAKIMDDSAEAQKARQIAKQPTDSVAGHLMLGTAEAYDALAEHADRRQTAAGTDPA